MAEAAVDQQTNTQLLKYFCHQCSDSVEIKASADATNLTCPKCESSFIEELTQELENDHLQTDGTYNPEALSFLRSSNPSRLLSSMLLSLGSVSHDDGDDDDDDSDDDGYYHFLAERNQFSSASQSGSTSTSTSASSRSSQQFPFHRFLEQLLGNLRAGNLGSDQPADFLPGFSPLLSQGFHGDPRDYAWGADGIDNIITQLLNQTEGTGPPPASEEDIDSLPSTLVIQDCVDRAIQCSVCLENFVLNEAVKCLPCEHIFHSDCVVPWLQLHRTCPICRSPVGGEATVDDSSALPSQPTSEMPGSLDYQHHHTSSQASSSEGNTYQVAVGDAVTMECAPNLVGPNLLDDGVLYNTSSDSDMET